MRTSTNLLNPDGLLIDGYDYNNQAWVRDGKYVACGHPDDMECTCYGRVHEGEPCEVRGDGL